MRLRRLTDTGQAEFESYLKQLKSEPSLAPPRHLLAESNSSDSIAPEVEVEDRLFRSRFEAAEYLYGIVRQLDLSQPERDAGLWTWLTLFYFDQLCPPKKDGSRKPGEIARYVPAIHNYQKSYRHLLLGPLVIFRAHADEPQRAMGLLATAIDVPGDIVEQFASRQERVTNRAVIGAVTSLYFDPERGSLKKGSGGKGKGSPRRLADLINQLDLTFDLHSLGSNRLLSLLPKEFDRFRA